MRIRYDGKQWKVLKITFKFVRRQEEGREEKARLKYECSDFFLSAEYVIKKEMKGRIKKRQERGAERKESKFKVLYIQASSIIFGD